MDSFTPTKIERKWQAVWEKAKIYQPDMARTARPFYNLMMFPYPSAEGLHVGNMYAFTGADIYGRYQRMQGKQVFEPIGLDGFGIHSENFAFKINAHPMEQAKVSQKRFYEQLRAIGNGFSWDHTLETYDPGYYKWTQWLFVQMFKNGLAERKSAWVNWCPSCKTVLADEQVEGGVCERCKSETTRKETKQWFFRITEYADRLLNNIYGKNAKTQSSSVKNKILGPVGSSYDPKKEGLRWPEKIKLAQRQWIGKVKGLTIYFQVEKSEQRLPIWTKFWETIFGTTFLVIAPEHPLVRKLTIPQENKQKVKRYVEESLRKTEQQRKAEVDKKTGVDTGIRVRNPVNDELVPLWIADYVLMDVGTGTVMGVPAHDERDFAFARKYKLPIKKVVHVQKETHALVIKKSIDEGFITAIEKHQWYWTDYEGWGYGVVVPKGVESEFISLIQKHLLTGSWYVHSDGVLQSVIFKEKVYSLPLENIKAKEFARKLQTPSKQIDWDDKDHYMFCHDKGGVIVNSGQFNGLDAWTKGKKKMAEWMIGKGVAKWEVYYHLRDWLISRQRYWGPPIPMVYCEKCAEERKSWFMSDEGSRFMSDMAKNSKYEARNLKQYRKSIDKIFEPLGFRNPDFEFSASMVGWWPIEEKYLPVLLPRLDAADVKPAGDGKAPLDKTSDDWLYVKCPECGGKAKRETDIIDNFVDSAWYFLAYPNLHTKEWRGNRRPFNKKITKRWLPVDTYVGGAEHAVLHLLYSRFICMALADWGYIDFEEPFPFLFSHGLIIKDGSKMSKSRGNVVIPDDYIGKYGADTLRMYLMFLGPYDMGGDFRDSGIHGMHKFLQRVWRLYEQSRGKIGSKSDEKLEVLLHRSIEKVGNDVKQFKYNTAISALMEFINHWENTGMLTRNDAMQLLLLFAPFAPHLCEELWQSLQKKQLEAGSSVSYRSIHLERWPKFDVKKVRRSRVEIVVQVNGKLRDRVVVTAATSAKKTTVITLAKQLPTIKIYLEKGTLEKVVFVAGRLVNFVVS